MSVEPQHTTSYTHISTIGNYSIGTLLHEKKGARQLYEQPMSGCCATQQINNLCTITSPFPSLHTRRHPTEHHQALNALESYLTSTQTKSNECLIRFKTVNLCIISSLISYKGKGTQ